MNISNIKTNTLKNLEQLKQVQAEISKRKEIIQDMNIPYFNKIKYDKEYYDYAEVITDIITGRADISLICKVVKHFQHDEIEYLKLISQRLSNFWQDYDQYFRLQTELEDLRKKEHDLKEKLGLDRRLLLYEKK